MKLFIEPNDVMMFRDGKPFSAGEDHFAGGVFPPYPATIYGALRSHILSLNWSEFDKYAKAEKEDIPEEILKEIGSPRHNESGSLVLRNFALAGKEDNGTVIRYWPMPADVAVEKNSDNKKPVLLKPVTFDNSRIITDLPGNLSSPWHRSEKVLTGHQGFLSTEEMKTYLSGNAPGKVKPDSALYEVEDRTGIRKNRSRRSVEDGGLYTVSYFRLRANTGFAVDVNGTSLLPKEGILRLGGDHRSALYGEAVWDDFSCDGIRAKIAVEKRFKIVLTTPAIFNQGWLPQGIDRERMEGSINGINVRLTGASLGKPVGIGGFDMVKRLPKPMKKAAPAGSVYYFELKDDADRLFDNLHLKSISDEKSSEGFGISIIGGI